MPNMTDLFRIWSYCDIEHLRPQLTAARCVFVEGPVPAEPRVREVTRVGLKVMFLPAYSIRAERRDGETDAAARERIYAVVAACEAEQDAREQAEADRRADNGLSKVLNHAIKVLWVLQRPNRSDEEVVTLELRRPSPREKRLFPDASGAVSAYEAAEVMESPDTHVKFRVAARPR
jgi:hypothetical protein